MMDTHYLRGFKDTQRAAITILSEYLANMHICYTSFFRFCRGIPCTSEYEIHVYYISYRVTGLYRLGKTCYLHSLLCNNSIIRIVYCAK